MDIGVGGIALDTLIKFGVIIAGFYFIGPHAVSQFLSNPIAGFENET